MAHKYNYPNLKHRVVHSGQTWIDSNQTIRANIKKKF